MLLVSSHGETYSQGADPWIRRCCGRWSWEGPTAPGWTSCRGDTSSRIEREEGELGRHQAIGRWVCFLWLIIILIICPAYVCLLLCYFGVGGWIKVPSLLLELLGRIVVHLSDQRLISVLKSDSTSTCSCCKGSDQLSLHASIEIQIVAWVYLDLLDDSLSMNSIAHLDNYLRLIVF